MEQRNNRSINRWCICRVWQTARPGCASSKSCFLLSADGLSVAELASQLLVNRRTVYRDIDFLSAQGVPLWQQDGRFGLNRTRYLATVRLSYQEAIALVLAGLLLARTLDERNPHVIAALRRLAAALPDFPGMHLKRAADARRSLSRQPCPGGGPGNHRRRLGQRSQSQNRLPFAQERRAAPAGHRALCPGTDGFRHLYHLPRRLGRRNPHLQAGARWRAPSCWMSPTPFRPISTRKHTWPAAGGSCPASSVEEVILRFTRSSQTLRHGAPMASLPTDPGYSRRRLRAAACGSPSRWRCSPGSAVGGRRSR